jgi:uncharacterized Fe-S radical SAM superfamily protein PflX
LEPGQRVLRFSFVAQFEIQLRALQRPGISHLADHLAGRDGLARRGVLVRHLVMPGLVEESAAIFAWLASEVSRDTYVNVMGQYRPEWRVGEPDATGRRLFEEIDRRPRPWEMAAAYEAARRVGLWRFDARLLAAPASGS